MSTQLTTMYLPSILRIILAEWTEHSAVAFFKLKDY